VTDSSGGESDQHNLMRRFFSFGKFPIVLTAKKDLGTQETIVLPFTSSWGVARGSATPEARGQRGKETQAMKPFLLGKKDTPRVFG